MDKKQCVLQFFDLFPIFRFIIAFLSNANVMIKDFEAEKLEPVQHRQMHLFSQRFTKYTFNPFATMYINDFFAYCMCFRDTKAPSLSQ